MSATSRGRRALKRLVVVAVAGLLSLVLAEGAVRIAGLGRKGSVGVLYRADGRLGWRHEAGITMVQEDREFAVTWHLDEQGLRRASSLGDGPRIAVLGDSHTAGHGVETDETWPSHLERLLADDAPGVTVLNAGVSGYGAAQQMLQLEELLEQHDLAGVLVASYLGNDLRELFEGTGIGGHRRPVLDRHFAITNPAGSEPHAARGVVDGLKAWLAEYSRLYIVVGGAVRDGPLQGFAAAFGLMDAPETGPPTARDRCGGCYGQLLWAQQRLAVNEALARRAVTFHVSLWRRMAAMCAERDVPFAAMLLPSLTEVSGLEPLVVDAARELGVTDDPKVLLDRWREAVLAASDDLPVVDLLPTMQRAATDDDLYYPFDWHLTPAGQTVVAEAAHAIVASAGWLRDDG